MLAGKAAATKAAAEARGIGHWTLDLAESLVREDVDCVILSTPTQMHADQAIQCLHAGKHVLVEIPMADNLADSRRLVAVQQETGLVAMAGHVRRFNPSHQWIHNKIKAGELSLQQLDVQTYFFRRTNTMRLANPEAGRIIFSGTMPVIQWIFFSTRPALWRRRFTGWKGRVILSLALPLI